MVKLSVKPILCFLFLISTLSASAQLSRQGLLEHKKIETSESYLFAERDTQAIYLDIYRPKLERDNGSTVIFVFGGGFVMGSRNHDYNKEFYALLVERGYKVVAIDYRLGLKGQKNISPLNPKPAFKAVDMATEDLLAATRYIIDNHTKLGIDTSRIFASGSSAGAITVLQADYEMSNYTTVAQILPETFRYRGVISFAGAVFSQKGKPKYARGAAPTLMFHGTKDKLVVYKKIQIFNIGMFGTDALVKIFNKNESPYIAIRYKGSGHEVANFPMRYDITTVDDFIGWAAKGNYFNQIDELVIDKFVQQNFHLKLSRSELYSGEVVDVESIEKETRQEAAQNLK